MARLALLISVTALVAAGCAAAPRTSVTEEADGPLRCRDVRQLGSNVIETLCFTEAGWKEYEASRRRQAQDMMRRMDEMASQVGGQ